MSDYVTTNIRLPKEDLISYRELALSMGKSFSALVRELLAKYTHPASVLPITKRKKQFSFWEIDKIAVKGGPKDGSVNHDKYIY